MNWNLLNTLEDLERCIELSHSHKIMLFKHSTRCSISTAALGRIERNWKREDSQKMIPYFLDLIAHRQISNLIASRFGVEHQSPQVLVVWQGQCIYHASHQEINYQEVIYQ